MRALQQWSSYGPEDLAYSDDVECQAEAMREEDERDRKKVEKAEEDDSDYFESSQATEYDYSSSQTSGSSHGTLTQESSCNWDDGTAYSSSQDHIPDNGRKQLNPWSASVADEEYVDDLLEDTDDEDDE
ncbi:hypothetical protein CC2G_001201 [Coprinopsis cinerea AmutBmut pab1-1]|nr:hypothetical protein CC2G_001201 [Coprinopsis cinerea AmutBmut pab1-1]